MTTISTLPTAPSRADPTTFVARSDALLGALDGFVTQTNLVAGEVNTAAATATTQAGLATTNGAAQVTLAVGQVTLAAGQVTLAAGQVTLATTQAVNAANSATAAAGSALVAGAVAWVSGTTYAVGDARYSPINMQTYRRVISGAGTTDPSLDTTNWTLALKAGITNVTTATGMTTLTNSPTLLSITPAAYGVAVTLPDATTCPLGGPLHKIDNRGAYPVRLLNSAGTLIGFVFAGVTSDVSLVNNATAAGVWDVSNVELVGASAQLLTTNLQAISACVALDANREYLQGNQGSTAIWGVVYDKSTNTFGAVTLIRTAVVQGNSTAILSAANQILSISCTGAGTAFQAVTLTISGTTITVNTAATATLSANISGFADGCGLIAVGSSFVTSYTVATPAAQIRALSISGTTVTIGAASVLDGTAGGLIAAAANHVIAVSTATSNLYTKPYLVTTSTLTAGTGSATGTGATTTLQKLAALGTRWFVANLDQSGASILGGVISLNATGNGTTTISTVTLLSSASNLRDAIVVGSNKVLLLGNQTSSNANLLTDTAGTASAGTAITLSDGNANRACLYVSGTTVYVADRTSANDFSIFAVGCSGASPVVSATFPQVGNLAIASEYICDGVSNAVLRRSPRKLHGTEFAQAISTGSINSTQLAMPRVNKGIPSLVFGASLSYEVLHSSTNIFNGVNASQVWRANSSTIIKLECV